MVQMNHGKSCVSLYRVALEGMRMGIREVAKMASVSTAAVSRLITGTAKVSPDAATRVLHAMQALNFQPNEAARTLAFQKKLKRCEACLRVQGNLETVVEFLLRLRRPGLSRVDHWLRPQPARMAPLIAGADTH
jgi:DNA-binding Lrp family transcriptional regulator